MNRFNVSKMTHTSPLYLYMEREKFQLDPPYQRASDIWTLDKKQLLIDSILNGFDIPKLYFHRFSQPKSLGGRSYSHAIIDGKQRLEAIWGYIDGEYALDRDFEFLADLNLKPGGLTYVELGNKFPRLKIRFDTYSLDVIQVDTDDTNLIEEMFSRLNEAVPLSAAEKRNAFGGPLPAKIRALAQLPFFTDRLPFDNGRYRHFDLAAKFLLIAQEERVVDTKKIYLDEFVRSWKTRKAAGAETLAADCRSVLDRMTKIFTRKDPLLRSVGMVTLYYYIVKLAMEGGWLGEVSRQKFVAFEDARAANRKLAESDIGQADYELLEFDRYVQSPNDGYAAEIRLNIVLDKVFDLVLEDA